MCNEYNNKQAQTLTLEEQISELQDVVASLTCQQETLRDELCQIIFEGEHISKLGLEVTLARLQDRLNYTEWLKEEE